jgi:hypothetical protein
MFRGELVLVMLLYTSLVELCENALFDKKKADKKKMVTLSGGL